MKKKSLSMEVINRNAAGIDVGSRSIMWPSAKNRKM